MAARAHVRQRGRAGWGIINTTGTGGTILMKSLKSLVIAAALSLGAVGAGHAQAPTTAPAQAPAATAPANPAPPATSSEERRVGKECVSPFNSRGWRSH